MIRFINSKCFRPVSLQVFTGYMMYKSPFVLCLDLHFSKEKWWCIFFSFFFLNKQFNLHHDNSWMSIDQFYTVMRMGYLVTQTCLVRWAVWLEVRDSLSDDVLLLLLQHKELEHPCDLWAEGRQCDTHQTGRKVSAGIIASKTSTVWHVKWMHGTTGSKTSTVWHVKWMHGTTVSKTSTVWHVKWMHGTTVSKTSTVWHLSSECMRLLHQNPALFTSVKWIHGTVVLINSIVFLHKDTAPFDTCQVNAVWVCIMKINSIVFFA